jgi:hypothetical protein
MLAAVAAENASQVQILQVFLKPQVLETKITLTALFVLR